MNHLPKILKSDADKEIFGALNGKIFSICLIPQSCDVYDTFFYSAREEAPEINLENLIKANWKACLQPLVFDKALGQCIALRHLGHQNYFSLSKVASNPDLPGNEEFECRANWSKDIVILTQEQVDVINAVRKEKADEQVAILTEYFEMCYAAISTHQREAK